ncbi:MAG: aldolase [Burkholderiales bacterium]|nr:aldolase [Burkholderiales bacterium]
MIELLQLTNDPALAKRCDAIAGMRLFIDLERDGKAERQAGRSTFISDHQVADIAPVKAVLSRHQLMVRLNPLNAGTAGELDEVIAAGADLLMLPMFSSAGELREFSALVAGRRPIIPLVETAAALHSAPQWIATPGLHEVFVGLNDLHIDLGCRFMFEPLAQGLLEPVAQLARSHGLRFGFGGIARLDEGMVPGRDVLAEHLRLGSQAVILSRTFREAAGGAPLEEQVQALRAVEAALATRGPAQVEADRVRIASAVGQVAARMEAAK